MELKDAIALVGEVGQHPVRLPEDFDKAIQHGRFHRQIVEYAYELSHQEAQRIQLRANKDELSERLIVEENTLPDHRRRHILGRIKEIDAKVWKSMALTHLFKQQLDTYRQILEVAQEHAV